MHLKKTLVQSKIHQIKKKNPFFKTPTDNRTFVFSLKKKVKGKIAYQTKLSFITIDCFVSSILFSRFFKLIGLCLKLKLFSQTRYKDFFLHKTPYVDGNVIANYKTR